MGDLYELQPGPTPPGLPGTVIVRDTVDDLTDAVASDLFLHATACVRAFGDFHIALSGGSTPLPLYRRLMTDIAYRELPWARTHLWMVDERCVPPTDERSNFLSIGGLIVEHSGIPPAQAHPVPATAPDGAQRYERELMQALAWREKGQDRLDYVLLGVGEDGHTASLFPHSPALLGDGPDGRGPAGRFIRRNSGPSVTPPDRITMTLELINGARFITLLVTGKRKRGIVARLASHAMDHEMAIPDLPALGVRPVGGELRWYLDAEACPDHADAAR